MRVLLAAAALVATALSVPAAALTATDSTGTVYSTDRVTVPLTFPVVGATSYSDNFLVCRSGCTRKHMGQDLMGAKMSPLVAACSGTVVSLRRETSQGSGNYLVIACDQGRAKGWSVMYLHVNNDTPGTDDGRGTASWAFPKGIEQGVRVMAGQLVGWRGDSGNAESTGPHLHFELRWGSGWSGKVYNAYPSLRAATRLAAPTASGPHPEGTLLATPGGAFWVVQGGKAYSVSNAVRRTNSLPYASYIPATAAEIALYPRGGALPIRSGALVRDPAGQVWQVSNGTRFPAVAPAGRVVVPVASADLANLAVVEAPDTPYVPGVLVMIDGRLHRVGDDGLLHLVPSSLVLRSWGFSVADALVVSTEPTGAVDPEPTEGWPAEEPTGPQLPDLGEPMTLRDGTFVSAGTRGIGVTSGGVFRRLWDSRQVRAYGYAGKAWQPVSASTVASMPTGEIAGPASPYGSDGGWRR